jgi:hypothetical protein
MSRTETIIQVIAVWLLSICLTSALFFLYCIPDLHTIVTAFGFWPMPLWVAYSIYLIISCILIIILILTYYWEWKQDRFQFTWREVVVYLLVIVIGGLLIIATHLHLLGLPYDTQFLIFDVLLFIIIGLGALLVGFLIKQAKENAYTILVV